MRAPSGHIYALLTLALLALSEPAYALDCPAKGPVAVGSRVTVVYDPADTTMKACVGSSWVNLAGGGGAANLDDLSDVVIASPANNQVLLFNGTNWVNSALSITETDPEVGALTGNQWCAANAGGTAIVCNQAPPSGGGGTSSGTAGYVQLSGGSGAFATSGTTAGEQLFWDNVNKRLGIGTSTPSAPLEVTKKLVISGSDFFGSVLSDTAQLYRDATLGAVLGGVGSQNDFSFTNKLGQIVIENPTGTRVSSFGGSVGIGTTSPSQALQVNGNIQSTGNLTRISLGAADNPYVNLYQNTSSGGLGLGFNIVPETSGWRYGNVGGWTGNGALWASYPGLYSLQVFHASNGANPPTLDSQFTIATSGNVGIGTDTPQSLLHVASTGYAQFTRNSAGAPTSADCDNALEFGRIVIDATNDRLYVCEGAVGWKYTTIGASGAGGASSGTAGYVQLSGGSGAFASSSSTAGQQLFWDSTNHRLGVGTATPSRSLQVAGGSGFAVSDAALNAIHTLANTGGGLLIDAFNGVGPSFVALNTNASGAGTTEKLRITSAGDVGIGTSVPDTNLHVMGALTPAIRIERSAATASDLTLQAQNGAAVLGSFKFNVPLIFATNNLERVRIDTSGNVGIGTVSPTNKLQVVGGARLSATTGIGALTLDGAANAWPFTINGPTTAGQSYGAIVMAGTNASDYALRVRNAAASSDFLSIRGDGNVGMGTTNPTTRLFLTDDVNNDVLTIDGPNGTLGKIGGHSLANGGIAIDSVTANQDLRLRTQGVDRLTIAATTGNVGIGTTAPDTTLTVAAGSAQFPTPLRLMETTHATSRRTGLTIGGWGIGQDANGNGTRDFFLWEANPGAHRIFVAPGGNVGIGASNPAMRLHVDNGNDSWQAYFGPTTTAARAGIWSGDAGNFKRAVFGSPDTGTALTLNTSGSDRVTVAATGNVYIGGLLNASHPLQMASGAHVTTGGVWTNASDARLKKDVHALGYGLERIPS